MYTGALLASSIFLAPWSLAQDVEPAADESGAKKLDTVIVNARRREESLQDVPIAITAKSQEDLDLFNIESVGDLQLFTPGLQAFGPYRDQPIVTLRGQGGFTPGGIPSVLMYINEVPAATSSQAGSPGGMLGGNDLLFDLQNVQVVKGPQGTLFGRNTTGGAVLVQSRRPQPEFGASVQVTGGNYNDREVEAVLNVPLAEDKFIVRFALSTQERDGFTFAESTPSHPDGLWLDDAQHVAGRLSVLFKPTASIENLLIVDSISSDKNGTSSILKDINDNPLHPVNQFFPITKALLAAQDARGERRLGALSADLRSDLDRWSITDILSIELTDNLTFKNIASYQDAEYARTVDGDGTILPIFDPVQSQARPFITRQFSEEAQLQWSNLLDGKLDSTFGVFYLDSPENDQFSEHRNVVFGQPRNVGVANSETTKAVFAQSDYDLSSLVEGLTFTGGVRYTWETISRRTRDVSLTGACTSPFSDANCVSSRSEDFEAPTWTVGLNYQVKPGTMVYVASRRGFRSGGFNLEGDTPADEVTFDEERVTDIEFGLKSDWSVNSIAARTNIAAYRQFYDDIQLPQFSTSSITGATLTVIRNAGKAEITGIELENRFAFGDRLELGTQLAWTDYEYTELGPNVVPPVIPTVPEWTYGFDGAVHLFDREDWGRLSARAAYSVTGDRYTASLIDEFAFQDEFGVLTLGVDWRDVGGHPVDLSFFMTNATDELYQVGSLPLSSTVGVSTIAYGAPRMWGIRLGYRYGSER
ncbi:TonB-dependent receptor [Henriciella litoralis]|uniref:TonB-dependent receptor n=1 Tax=Henriciella litoralis TaxID=568102 RepID=UPI0009FDDF72|nr:TonB-dependent receptor [Henriciella litoralis]